MRQKKKENEKRTLLKVGDQLPEVTNMETKALFLEIKKIKDLQLNQEAQVVLILEEVDLIEM